MVNISELETDVSIGGAEQLVVNDGGTTKKVTVDTILARTHNHTASQVTDFNTAVDARIDVLTDTAKTTPVDTDVFALWDTVRKKVTWANIKATLKTYFDTLYHTKNALRTGLTASKALITDGSGNEGYADLPSSVVKVAGENVTAGDALRMANVWAGDTISQTTNSFTRDVAYDATSHSVGQSFTTVNGGLLTNIQIRLQRIGGGSPAGNMSVQLYSDLGITLIANTTTIMTAASIGTGSPANYNFAFNNIPLKPGTIYYIKIGTTGATSTTNYLWIRVDNNVYAGGVGYQINSSNSRTSPRGGDLYFVPTITATTETSGRVYKTSASFDYNSYIVGFANNTATTGNNVTVDQTYTNKLTGLTTNTTYYLGNTAGTIGTSAGTVSRVVGRSISTTELLINLFG